MYYTVSSKTIYCCKLHLIESLGGGATSDAVVRITDGLRGITMIQLPRGSHTIKLQWRHSSGLDTSSWQIASEILDGFGGGASLVAVYHAFNEAPEIHFDPVDETLQLQIVQNEPVTVTLLEDGSQSIKGFSISDLDSEHSPDNLYAVTILAAHGMVSLGHKEGLSFATGDGNKDQLVVMIGTLDIVNKAVFEMIYTGSLNFFGEDLVTISVNDQGSSGVGVGGDLTASMDIHIIVNPVNDRPTFAIPNYQVVNEDEELEIYGITLHDPDVEPLDDVSVFRLSLVVVGGVLNLFGDLQGVKFLQGTGKNESAMTLLGTMKQLNEALSKVNYLGNTDSNKFRVDEVLTMIVSDMGLDEGSPDALTSEVKLPITVEPVNDAPTIVVPRSLSIGIDGLQLVDLDLSDPRNDDLGVYQIRLAVSSGASVVSLGSEVGLTFTEGSSGDSTMGFSGTLKNINAALGSILYSRLPAFDGEDDILMTVVDPMEITSSTLVGVQLSNEQALLPSIVGIYPEQAFIDPEQPVSVLVHLSLTSNVDINEDWYCQFGTMKTIANWISISQLSCPVPMTGVVEDHAVLLRITNAVNVWTSAIEFFFQAPFHVEQIVPSKRSCRFGYNCHWKFIFHF